jgi:hypothetical protein
MRRIVSAALFSMLVLAEARGATILLTSHLTGSQEVPPTGSAGTGDSVVTVDTVAMTLMVNLTFSGISAPASMAHIHCCAPPGVNAIVAVPFVNFPNATAGTYTNTFDLTSAATYNPAYITAQGGTVAGAEAALLAAMTAGLTYDNIHNANFPGGEIRGQLTPEPSTMSLALAALGSLLAAVRRRRNATQ